MRNSLKVRQLFRRASVVVAVAGATAMPLVARAATDVPNITDFVTADDKTALLALVGACIALGFGIFMFKTGFKWVKSWIR